MTTTQILPHADNSHSPQESPQVVLYSRLRKSPYFPASSQHGVRAYSVYNHTYHPRCYDDPFNEYFKLLNHVTLWDVGVERQIEITGPDAFAFTNMLTPRDLTKCAVGQCKYVVLTAEDGGIVNDPVLLRLGEDHFWLSLADSDVLLWARALAYGMGFNVQIREADVAPVQVQGPRSKEVMLELFGPELIEEMPYYHMTPARLDGMEVVVSRTGYSAEVGYEIYLYDASRDAVKLWNTVMEAGFPYGMSPIGPNHIRRIEAGMLAYGADMNLDTNPYEVGLGWMVKLDQGGDFLGKEALRRVKAEGVKRKLVGVEIEGEPLGGYVDGSMVDFFPVFLDGLKIGQVTSACYSPRLEKNIGYAMVPVQYSAEGTELVVETSLGLAAALLARKPFIDPKKEVPKS
jgi:glycine cleavage system aminomethyltransferase T